MSHIDLLDAPDFRRRLDQCIHCGLCLSACPTYVTNQAEMDSPRGRIALMRAAADGRIGLDGPFQEHIELCLGCRACETACPSGVQYGALLETTKAALADRASTAQRAVAQPHSRKGWPTARPSPRAPRISAAIQSFGLHELMPSRARLRWLARGLWLYQRLGLSALAARLPLPAALRTMEGMAPPIRLDYPDYSRPAPAYGQRRGKVAFFTGCVQDAFLANVNRATIRVLQRNGYEVHFPASQTCCGAAALHSGDLDFSRDLARRNVDAFAGDDFVAIVNNAGGCGATLDEYAHLLADDPAYAARAAAFADKVRDISEFLCEHLHAPPRGRVQARVAYVDSCHLRHGQKVSQQPRTLLRGISGLELVELSQPDQCCGSAGIYNLLQPEMANAVLDRKLADVRSAAPGIIVTANTGCYMQMVYGVKRAGLNATVLHVVEVLERAYANGAQ